MRCRADLSLLFFIADSGQTPGTRLILSSQCPGPEALTGDSISPQCVRTVSSLITRVTQMLLVRVQLPLPRTLVPHQPRPQPPRLLCPLISLWSRPGPGQVRKQENKKMCLKIHIVDLLFIHISWFIFIILFIDYLFEGSDSGSQWSWEVCPLLLIFDIRTH